jgi:transposase
LYFGAKTIKGKRGRGSYATTIVFGISERNGKAYTEIAPDCSRATLQAIVSGKEEAESVIHSDKWRGARR